MILIWSGEGGPLQYFGLAIFCLQFVAPHVMQYLQYVLHNVATNTTTNTTNTTIHCAVAIIIASALLAAGIILRRSWMRDGSTTRYGTTTAARGRDDDDATTTTRASGAGTPDDPVVIHDDENENEHVNGIRSRGGGATSASAAGGRGSESQSSSSSSSSSSSLRSTSSSFLALSLMIAYVPLFLASPVLWNMFLEGITGSVVDINDDDVRENGNGGGEGDTTKGAFVDTGFVHLVVLAMLAHTVMAMAAYRVLRDVLLDGGGGAGGNGGGIWSYPGNNRGTTSRRSRGRKLTVTEIADIGGFYFSLPRSFVVCVVIVASRILRDCSSFGIHSSLSTLPFFFSP
jgi:hypothetical protein